MFYVSSSSQDLVLDTEVGLDRQSDLTKAGVLSYGSDGEMVLRMSTEEELPP